LSEGLSFLPSTAHYPSLRRIDVIRRFVLAAALAGCLAWPTAAAAQKPSGPLQAAAAWLRTQQQADGGFSNGFVPGSDPGATADAVLAIAALGESPAAWVLEDNSPLDFLEQSGQDRSPGRRIRQVALAASRQCGPRSFGGVDLIAGILDDYSAQVGLFGAGPFDSALALQAGGSRKPAPEAPSPACWRRAWTTDLLVQWRPDTRRRRQQHDGDGCAGVSGRRPRAGYRPIRGVLPLGPE
jgi:hypothetical protein